MRTSEVRASIGPTHGGPGMICVASRNALEHEALCGSSYVDAEPFYTISATCLACLSRGVLPWCASVVSEPERSLHLWLARFVVTSARSRTLGPGHPVFLVTVSVLRSVHPTRPARGGQRPVGDVAEGGFICNGP
jgi:hypothetical protein